MELHATTYIRTPELHVPFLYTDVLESTAHDVWCIIYMGCYC